MVATSPSYAPIEYEGRATLRQLLCLSASAGTMILVCDNVNMLFLEGNPHEKGNVHWRTKLNASPGGGVAAMIELMAHCQKSPENGALNGLLLANHSEQGRIPSRPSSWTTKKADSEIGVADMFHR